MKRKHWIALLIVIAGAGIAALLVLSRPEPQKQEREASAPLVEVQEAKRRTGPLSVRVSGTVQPSREVRLASQVAGRVVFVSDKLRPGLRVAAQSTLVRLEQSDYENAIRQAQAAVAEQQVALVQAQEEAKVAEDELERFEDRAAELGLAPSETNRELLLRQPQLEAARAALERARASLEDARLQLRRTELSIPFDGYVRSEDVDEGDYVQPGQNLAVIYDAGTVEVLVPLTGDQAALVPKLWQDEGAGATARVFYDYGGARYVWSAEVARAQAALDPQTRTIDAIVSVPVPFEGGSRISGTANPSGVPPLLVGAFVDVEIQGREIDGYYALPRRALRRDRKLWLMRPDQTLRIVEAEVLQSVAGTVYLQAPIEADEMVVVSDLRVATPGMKIRPGSEVEQADG